MKLFIGEWKNLIILLPNSAGTNNWDTGYYTFYIDSLCDYQQYKKTFKPI